MVELEFLELANQAKRVLLCGPVLVQSQYARYKELKSVEGPKKSTQLWRGRKVLLEKERLCNERPNPSDWNQAVQYRS